MKYKHLLLTLMTLISLSISSCDKDKDDNAETPEGLAAKLLGTWQINAIIINEIFGGADHISNYPGTAADYVEFKSNGKMHTFFRGQLDVSNYKVISDKKITIDSDEADIKTITDNSLVIYTRDITGSIGYTEVTYDLKR